MKTLPKYLVLLFATTGLITTAFAQRGEHRGGGGIGGGGRQSFSSSRQSSPSFSRGSSSFSRQDRPTSFSQPRQNIQAMNRDNTSFRTSFRNNNSFVQRSNQRVVDRTSIARVNTTVRTGGIARYSFAPGGYRYSYAPRRFFYAGYPHYSVLPRTFVSISFGGYPYFYNNGLFYSYYGGFYEPVYAPFGICINTLPFGYYPFYWGGMPYYYYDGVYYRDHGDNEYEVVDAPMGAVVTTLPKGAKSVTVNGEKFYEFNGTYYKEGTNDKNEVVYTVVGKNGQVNNSDDPNANVTNQQRPLQMGDIVSTLPDNCKQVTINGQVLYVSPDNVYFKQRVDNGTTSYEVVGSSDEQNSQ
jgi:hypothetical protein